MKGRSTPFADLLNGEGRQDDVAVTIDIASAFKATLVSDCTNAAVEQVADGGSGVRLLRKQLKLGAAGQKQVCNGDPALHGGTQAPDVQHFLANMGIERR